MKPGVLSAYYTCGVVKKNFHYHNCHELLYVADGWAEMEINRKLYRLTAGDLVIVSRLEQHAILSYSPDYKRYVVQISPGISTDDFREYELFSVFFNRPGKFQNVIHFTEGFHRIKRLFNLMINESAGEKLMREDMLGILIQELLILVCRAFPENFRPDVSDDTKIIRIVQSRLDRDYAEKFSLKSLSEEYGLSISYLSHKFKSITGKPVMDYLQCSRIEAAKEYLAGSNMKISEIIEACGFSDASNFSRLFMRVTGKTPKEFRAAYRE